LRRSVKFWGALLLAVACGVLASARGGAAIAPPAPPGTILGAPTSVDAQTVTSGFQDTIVYSGLSLPSALRFAPDGRIFIAEIGGVVKEFDSLSDPTPTTVTDLSGKVDKYWDRGLLGLAIDPNFPASPYLYVLYTYDAPIGGTAPRWNDACPTPPGPTTDGCVVSGRLSKLTIGTNNVATGEQVLINDWCQQFPSHSIGDLRFGPDGMLYVSGGEGASFNASDYGQFGGSAGSPTPKNPCGDPPGGVGTALTPPTAEGGALRSQSVRRPAGEPVTLDGSILRLDPATGAAAPGNPLASSPDANARRIVAYGLRNPFRMTFRPGTNELWVGDVGWNTWEEVNRITNPTATPLNFGWPCYEGAGPQPGYQSAGLAQCQALYDAGNPPPPPPPSTGTFGETTPGTLADSATVNFKEVANYTAVASNVTKLTGYISGLGASTGTQKLKAVIYANVPNAQGGNPGALLGVSNEVTVTAGQPWGWVDFTFPSPVSVSAGTIWMGYIGSTTNNLTKLRYASQNRGTAWNINSGGYAAGPSNPFGTPSFASIRYSLYATYTNGSGGGGGGSTTTPATGPYYTYAHSANVVANDGCAPGGSSVTGLAFYNGGSYPSSFNGALFFADHTRQCIWVMKAGANGLPDPTQLSVFESGSPGPVALEIGPGGDLFYVDFDNGKIHRISFLSSNNPPVAVASGSPTSGAVPLTVTFNGSGSSDPDAGDTLSYSWDLNGDGTFGDSTAANPTFTYTTAGNYSVRLRVTDNHGASDTSAPIAIQAGQGNAAPVPSISAPASTLTWQVGQSIDFSGSATDQEDGAIPASGLTWDVILHHCFDQTNCHTHQIQTFSGVANGAFNAPDHEYPCWLELRLTAVDSSGASTGTSVRLDPKTVDLTFASSPTGATLGLNSATATAPFTKTVVVGSTNTINAPSPQTLGSSTLTFASWSDGGAASHNVVAAATNATYTATFTTSGGGPTTGTFGDTTIGTLVDSATANLKEVSSYTAVASNVTKLTGYISGLGAASGTQKLRGVIYANNAGNPGALLGVSNEVTVNAGQAWGWVDFTFPAPITVPGATVWMGYIGSTTNNLTQLRYTSVNRGTAWNTNSGGYAAGPSNPFGTPSFASIRYSLYATYNTG
jgi:glucose/arabinose dehydrogenase